MALGNNYIYTMESGTGYYTWWYVINRYTRNYLNWNVQLTQVDETTYDTNDSNSKTFSTQYLYDNNGNVTTEYHYGGQATSIGQQGVSSIDYSIWRVFNANATANILDKPARERTYPGVVTSDNGTGLKAETDYYYDNETVTLNNGLPVTSSTPPPKGNLTKKYQLTGPPNNSYINVAYVYDTYGNKLTEQDPNGNTTTWTYDSTHTYPASKTDPAVSGGDLWVIMLHCCNLELTA